MRGEGVVWRGRQSDLYRGVRDIICILSDHVLLLASSEFVLAMCAKLLLALFIYVLREYWFPIVFRM